MEIEAKFAIANRQIYRDLLRLRSLSNFSVAPTGHVKMADRYFDTADGALLDAGYTLRIRTDNQGVLATLKGMGGVQGALHRRDEQEVRLPEWTSDPAAWPESAARDLALSLTDGQSLQPLFDLEQDRARAAVRDGQRQVAELSLDEVRAAVGRRPAFYYELEIELSPGGTEAELTDIATALETEYQLLPEPRSKFERALVVLRSRGAAVQSRLDEEELHRLRTILNSGNVELSRRAGAVLGWAEGLPTREIVARTGLSSGRVRFWMRAWRARRMDIFTDAAQAQDTAPVVRSERSAKRADSPAKPLQSASPREVEGSASQVPAEPEPMRQKKGGLPTVMEFARANGVDLEHARFVAKHAVALFDALRGAHRLPRKRRKLLRQAALLCDAGARQDPNRPHRAGRDLILAQPLHDTDTSDRLMLACIVAFQREKVKPDREPAMQALAPKQRQHALTLAGLLQMAEALDASGTQATLIDGIDDCDAARCEVFLSGPAADVDALQATARSGLWRHMTGREVAFLAHRPALIPDAGQTRGNQSPVSARAVPPRPDPAQAIEVSPMRTDEPMSEAGRKTLLTHFLKMLANEQGTRLGEDIEALHDMRVATRRMRAAYRVFAPYFQAESLDQFNKDLRRIGRILGAVRDLDVLIEKADAYQAEKGVDEDSSIAPLLADWHARRELARREMLDYLNSSAYSRFVDRFRTFLTTPGAGALDIPAGEPRPHQVRHVAPVLILERYEVVRSYEAVLTGAPLTTYHALRIEFKGLRYALEFFKDVLGNETSAVIKQVTSMQDLLGALQDAHVAEGLITTFLSERSKRRKKTQPVVLSGVGCYLAAQQQLQQDLLIQVPESWSDIIGRDFRRALASALATP